MDNVVGIDWDHISFDEAKQRQRNIEQTEDVATLLFQTEHGFHIKLVYSHNVSVEENFSIRKKYGDCQKRLFYSRARYETTGEGNDILFNMKNGIWRKLV